MPLSNGIYYVRACKLCGEVFKTDKRKVYICERCKNRKKPKSVKPKPTIKKITRRKKVRDLDISIDEMLRRLEKYNKKHGTVYTYGQFVGLIYTGKIK